MVDSLYWIHFFFLVLMVFMALLAVPLLLGRLFMPRLTLALFRRFGGWLSRFMDRISPGLDLRLLVRASNGYFRKTFAATPYNQRLLFLPFCLCPPKCPVEVDPVRGLLCIETCPGCELGRLRQEAVSLGYAGVYVVPSSRMLRGRGLLPSDQFMRAKFKQHSPAAVLGVVCNWYLRRRLLTHYTVGRRGYSSDGNKHGTVLQGVLFERRNCKDVSVNWALVRHHMLL